MPAITLGPIASGLPKDIVQRLLEIEKQPVKQIELKKAHEKSRLDLVNELSKKITGIRDEFQQLARQKQFLDLKPEIGRPELMEATVDKTLAKEGTYQFEIAQLAGRSSMMSNGFEDKDDTQIGVGYFSYELPDGETREVFIDYESSTLQGIARKINQQKDLNLDAIVVNDGMGEENPWRLIITHKETGEVNDAEFPTFYFLDGDEDFYLEKEKPAQNSIIKVNGFPVEFPGVKVDTLLPGVTLDLKEAAPGKEFTFSIVPDIETIRGKIIALVEKVNEVLQFVQDQNKLDENSPTYKTLGGDITISNLENRLRSNIFAPIPTSTGLFRLSDLGIRFEKTGLLTIDENKLDAQLDKNMQPIIDFFTGDLVQGEGFIFNLDSTIRGFTQPGGIIPSRQAGIKRRIDDYDRQIEQKERHLAQRERMLKEKFSRLESSMAQLKSQQAQVASTLKTGSIFDQLSFTPTN